MIDANNQDHVVVQEPQTARYFRPWEENTVPTAARSNAAAPRNLVSPMLWWNYWLLNYYLMLAIQSAPATWPGGAMSVSPQSVSTRMPLLSNHYTTMETQALDEQNAELKKRVDQLSLKQIEQIIPYRREMARTFAPKVRTPAEQRRREKNTEACRLSRRRKKLREFLRQFSKMTKNEKKLYFNK